MTDSWVIYALLGVLLFLIAWRTATQWRDKSAEAVILRASVIVLGVIIAALFAWYLMGLR